MGTAAAQWQQRPLFLDGLGGHGSAVSGGSGSGLGGGKTGCRGVEVVWNFGSAGGVEGEDIEMVACVEL